MVHTVYPTLLQSASCRKEGCEKSYKNRNLSAFYNLQTSVFCLCSQNKIIILYIQLGYDGVVEFFRKGGKIMHEAARPGLVHHQLSSYNDNYMVYTACQCSCVRVKEKQQTFKVFLLKHTHAYCTCTLMYKLFKICYRPHHESSSRETKDLMQERKTTS